MAFRRFFLAGSLFCLAALLLLVISFFGFSTSKYISLNGVVYRICLADTPETRGLGLMFQQSLPRSQGMFFVFDREDFHVFWMKNTYVPLDMLWIDSHFKVVDFYCNAKPSSELLIVPTRPALYVLELNAGEISAHNFRPGMRVKVNAPLLSVYYFFQEGLNWFRRF
jgi:uncharacterized membrane protein (UPF0127 family)